MEQSVVSVDVVALRFWDEDGGVRLGIAPRAMEPFAGQLALPGVLLGRGSDWLSRRAERCTPNWASRRPRSARWGSW